MPALIKALGLERLSPAERIQLAEELWDSVAASPEAFTLSEAHKQDLQRRLDAYRDDPKAGAPWEEVRARLTPGPVPVTNHAAGEVEPPRGLADVIREIAAGQRARGFPGQSAEELRAEDDERDRELEAAH